MTLLDRFRSQSRDKHADPAVRLAFVETIPLDDHVTIAAVAREDEDPRVRKAAVAKLMDPAALAAIAKDDTDDGVRSQAAAMLRDMALEVFEDVSEAASLAAVDAIGDPRTLAQVAKTSTRDSVGERALARISDPRLLGSVARHAVVEAVRLRAFDSLRAAHQGVELLAVALNSDFKDTAVAAVDTISNRGELELIIARGKNKGAIKRARTIIREAEEKAAREAADQQMLDALAADPLILEPKSETATPPHGDALSGVAPQHGQGDGERSRTVEGQPANAESDTAAAEADAHPTREDEHRVRLAAQAEALETAARETRRRQARLGELADEAALAAAEADFAVARKRFAGIRREWKTLASGVEVEPAIQARFTELDTQLTARENESREADAKVRGEALARLNHFLARVEPLVEKADLSIKAVDRALKDVRAAAAAIPQLPTKQDFDEVTRRLKAVQSALMTKLQELRDADDWKRFGNVTIQEQLCAKMEALKTAEDLEAAAQQVRDLQQQWKAAADVPRAQADALWKRFKAAHDEVWTRCEQHFAAQAQVRNDNLAKKVTLCEKAEQLADSTNWIQTADAIKALQAEWKTIGPVSRGREKAIWDRFRGACDKFFTRRHDDLADRKASWADNLAKKDALCVRAEALAESSDWDQAAAELKKLQGEWKTIGAVKKTKSDAIWTRFRAACDKFFQRYAQRHDTARAERVQAREAICAELEALAAPDEPPADLIALYRGARGRWQQEVAARGVDPDRARALDQRFAAAAAALVAKWPGSFNNTEFDAESNRKRMEALVKKTEDLAASIAGPAHLADQNLSPTTRLAAMLKEALAANTIGGRVEEESRVRAAAEEARQAQQAFSRIGQVSDADRRALGDRLQRAIRKINDRAGQAGRPGGSTPPNRPGPPNRPNR